MKILSNDELVVARVAFMRDGGTAYYETKRLYEKGDGGYACDQSGAYLVDQARETLLDLLGDMDAVRPDRFNEDLRNKLIAEARALFKKIKGVYFKDYLTWFESVISKISVQDSRLVFTEDPAPIVVGKNLNTLILFA